MNKISDEELISIEKKISDYDWDYEYEYKQGNIGGFRKGATLYIDKYKFGVVQTDLYYADGFIIVEVVHKNRATLAMVIHVVTLTSQQCMTLYSKNKLLTYPGGLPTWSKQWKRWSKRKYNRGTVEKALKTILPEYIPPNKQYNWKICVPTLYFNLGEYYNWLIKYLPLILQQHFPKDVIGIILLYLLPY